MSGVSLISWKRFNKFLKGSDYLMRNDYEMDEHDR